MNDDGGWKRRSSRYVYKSKWYNVRKDDVVLPNGDGITYTSIEHPGFVMVVPLLEDGRVIMENVYRYAVQRTLLECPSGGLDGEEPEVAARRELEEETGYRARTLTLLGRFVGSSGISDEEYNLYLATGLSADGQIAHENTEQIEVKLMPITQLRTMALQARIVDAPSALGILLAWEKLKELKLTPGSR